MIGIAAQTGSTQPSFVDAPEPRAPQNGEVLCRTLELGVCGTDREILKSSKPWVPAGEDRLILGHECLARIEAVGPGVVEYRVGDLVVPVVRRALPGHSRRPDLLPFGAFVERGIVREHGFSLPLWIDRPQHLFRVPADIVDLAVFTEPLTCAEKGINEATVVQRARLSGDATWTKTDPPRVLVTGMGPIGFAGVLAAAARGWPVTMVGRDQPDTFRTRLVERLGGHYLPMEASEVSPDRVENAGYDLLLECTGSDDVLLHATASLRSCGVIVWVGSDRVPQPEMRNVQKMVREGLLRNHIHIGCVNAAARDFRDALRDLSLLAKDSRAELTELITARVKPENALPHYEHRESQGIKTVVMYQ
jgi:threonine dehydrogenase-like Zn-dependent dehydrogenase